MPRLPTGLLLPSLLALLLGASGCGSKNDDCPSGQTLCRGVCVDPASYVTDPTNCGECGIACGIGTCAGGVCQCEGATSCAGLNPVCRDLQTDPRSCNACGFACPLANEACVAGSCECPATLPTPCPDVNPDRCVDTQTDASNCGGCGNVCSLANEVCVGGDCQCPAALPNRCPEGAPDRCVNTQTSASNCGSCGHVCPLVNDVCESGQCICPATSRLACPLATPTRCVDPDTDESNCGACDRPCAQGATCVVGNCECPAGQTVCGSGSSARCVNLQADAENCGTCGRACPAGSSCSLGSCVCGDAAPQACGDLCCEGTDCCGNDAACQTKHFNGFNANYFDCEPLDQHTLAQARLAAESWSPTGTTREAGLQCLFCLCRESPTLMAAVVWCYAGSPNQGFATVTNSPNCLAALCPNPGTARVVWR